MLGDFKLVDGKIISSKDIVDVFSSDNALVSDANGVYNLELEVNKYRFSGLLSFLLGKKQFINTLIQKDYISRVF